MKYINPSLDVPSLQAQFQRNRRLLIRDVLQPEVAEAVFGALDAIDWALDYRDGRADCRLAGPQLRELSAGRRAELTQLIHAVAKREFQFSFFTHSLVESAHRGETDLLTRFLRWMADEPFMSLMRQISGISTIDRVYGQATMYAPGNFLLIHDDHVDSESRKLAYVVNFTRRWRPDWGGLLHFTDDAGNVVDTFAPQFNSIALFAVPQTHFVSYVPPFAVGQRYAISGWLVSNKD